MREITRRSDLMAMNSLVVEIVGVNRHSDLEENRLIGKKPINSVVLSKTFM